MIFDDKFTAAEYSRRQLLHTALNLFAEYGIDTVSMRMVNREAGQKNTSALHYHFGNKAGLIEALMKFLQGWFEKSREDGLVELEKAADAGSITINMVVKALIHPYRKLVEDEKWGYSAIRFLARLEFDGSPEAHVIVNRFSSVSIKRFKRLIIQSLPEVPPKILMHRWNMCLTGITQGLADHKNLKYSYIGDMSCSVGDLTEMYVEYHSAGLSAPVKN
jgi:AcrR family transcriptional regulator